MIRLVRGDEPDALRDKRPGKLAEVRARRAVGDDIKLTGYGFEAVANREDARTIVDAWSRLCRCLDAPGQEFRALSRDAVDALARRDIRNRYRLAL